MNNILNQPIFLDVSDNVYNGHDEFVGDVTLGGFNVSQLANKLERLALATPQTTRIKPDNPVIEEDLDFNERPESVDSDSGRPVTSNDSSIYRSFIGDSVENQQLDSLEFSSTICNDDINESGGNIESIHENLSSVNLDLVSSDFEDSAQNLTVHSHKSLSEETLQNHSHLDFNNLTRENISLMDSIGSDTKFKVCNKLLCLLRVFIKC